MTDRSKQVQSEREKFAAASTPAKASGKPANGAAATAPPSERLPAHSPAIESQAEAARRLELAVASQDARPRPSALLVPGMDPGPETLPEQAGDTEVGSTRGSCGACRAWNYKDSSCRMHAPAMVPLPQYAAPRVAGGQPELIGFKTAGLFPAQPKEGWCMEFKPKG